jgi:hypothetical protein
MPPASQTTLLFLSLSLPLLGGCAAASGTPGGNDTASCAVVSCGPSTCGQVPCAIDAFVPSFCPDGRLRRDVATDAPMFVVPGPDVAALAPRFNDDGTVCRDTETGSPLYEEVSDGQVVRVIVSAQ